MTALNNLTDTWNNGATVFTALKYNVTNTASAAGSKLFDFQIGGNTVFNYDVNAGILSLQNTTNAQVLRVYNSFTDASNYERGVFDWAAAFNTLTIGTEAAGTGSQRQIQFKAGGNYYFSISGTGSVQLTRSGGASFIFIDKIGLDYNNGDTILARGAAGIFQFGSSQSFSANGSVATAITSVGPTGASTTVQEWLTIKNVAGTTRYIPCF
jgi:hypothetical protein